MPPDKPKNFISKLQKAPEKVEGGKKAWAKFRKDTKTYYDNHKAKVSKLMREVKGPAADKMKKLKGQYLSEMSNSVDHVIDGNEATMAEMAAFTRIFKTKSIALKARLTREHNEHQIRSTMSELEGVKDMFQVTGLRINLKTQVIAYLQLPKSKRLPIKTIKVIMKSLFDMETKLGSREFANIIKENKNLVYTIFNHCCLGNKSSALKEMKKVKSEVNFRIEINQISKQTGIKKLTDRDLNGMMSALMKSGIPRKKVASFLITNINKLKKLDPKSFNKILKAAGSSELSRLLLTAVVGISSGTSEKVKTAIRLTLQIEGQIMGEKTKAIDNIKQNSTYIKTNINKLKAYRKKNPNITIDTTTLALEKNISEGITNIHFHKKLLLRAQVTHIIANKYLSKKGLNPAYIKKLLSAKDANSLAGLCLKELKVSLPPQLNVLRAAEFKEKASTIEFDFKKYYHSSFKKIHQFGENSGQWTWADSIKEFYKTGKLDSKAKSAFNEQFDAKAARQMKLVDEYASIAQGGHGENFTQAKIAYKTMKGVPKEKLGEVAAQLTGHLSVLKNVHSTTVHLVGNLEGLLLTTSSSERKAELKAYIKKYKGIAKDLAIKINEVYKFVGKKEDKKLLSMHENAVSPIHAPLILNAFSADQSKLNKIGQGVAAAAGPVRYINQRIKRMHKLNPQLVYHEFTQGMKIMDNLVGKLENARAETLKIHGKLVAALKATDGMNLPTGLKNQRKKILKQVLDNIEKTLNGANSPLMSGNIQKVKNGRTDLKAARDKYAMDGLKRGVVIACVMAAAIGAAVVGGMAAGALGAKMFGSVAAGSVGAGWIPVGAGVASFATGSLSMMGVAAGSVVGAKLTQQFFTSFNIMDFRKTTEDIHGRKTKESLWKTEDLLEEYSYAFVMSLVAVGAAKGIMKGLKHFSTANYYQLRFPGLVKFSQSALGKMDIIGKIANPGAWFQGAREGAKRGFLRQAGKQTVGEAGEELVEEVAGKLHPLAGFLASVANAADGCSVSLAMHGLKTADTGIAYNGGIATYTTKTPQEFINNLESKFREEKGFNHEATINEDGSVTLVMYAKVKDKVTGKTRMAKYRMIDIHPAQSSADVSPDTELARVAGLSQVDKKGEIYTINSATNVVPALSNLSSRGFLIVDKGNGNYQVSKGESKFTINLDSSVAAEIKNQINQWTNTPQKKSAFVKFMLKFNGDFQKFRAKYPKLAKILPSDLTKIKIPVPVVGLFAVAAFEMKSTQELSGMNKFFKPEMQFKVRDQDGEIKTYEVLSIDQNTGDLRVVDLATGLDMKWNTASALLFIENFNHESGQAAQLATRLYAIGLDIDAADISDLSANFLSSSGTNIKTIKDREAVVLALESAHESLVEEVDWIRDCGFETEANIISDYSNTNYATLGDRFLAAKNISDKLNYLQAKGLQINGKNAPQLIAIFDLKSADGVKVKALFKNFQQAHQNQDPDKMKKNHDALRSIFEPILGIRDLNQKMGQVFNILSEKISLDIKFDANEFEALCKTDAELKVFGLLKNQLGSGDVTFNHPAIQRFMNNAEFQNNNLNISEKLKLFAQIKIKTNEIKKDTELNQEEKAAQLKLLAECKGMLKDGFVGGELNHGSNSYTFNALTVGNPELLSGAELQVRGIVPKSGEQDLAGGSAIQNKISAGQNIDGLGTARAYAKLNGKAEGYKDPVHFKVELLQQRISEFKQIIQKFTDQGIEAVPNDPHLKKKTYEKLLKQYEQALQRKLKDPRAGDKEPYQLIFGMNKGNLQTELTEGRTYGEALSGEVDILTPSISLKKQLKVMYVSRANIAEARAQLIKLVGPKIAKKIKIYSIESLDMMGNLMGDESIYNATSENTYEILSQMVSFLTLKGFKVL